MTYTVDEANALLPHLAPALVELRDKFDRAAEVRATIARAAVTNGGTSTRRSWQALMSRVAELLGRLEEWGVELRDVESGLVDFPAVVEGRDAFLCWRLGEPEVAYWHPRDTGFAGRRPL
ncbi:MAG TPA: DUF2203 domain-containing protein [Actinomycetota bacterium]|nr:DUF2203 domain-containing protein [Actinomycetota bacterium]